MLTWIRESFGRWVIGGIIGFIACVFVFYGVFTPKGGQGMNGGIIAGSVNGDPITLAEYSRVLNQRMAYMKQMMGGKISEDQMKAFRIRDNVFNELVNQKLMLQEARNQGIEVSDEETRNYISKIPSFQVNGKFDPIRYKEVLQANNYSPGSFERTVREDLLLQQWEKYFQNRIRVSEQEIKDEYSTSEEKRDVKYALLTPELIYKNIEVKPDELQKFLKDPQKVNILQAQFNSKKDSTYKGMTFDVAKEKIAHAVLASEKTGEVQKASEKLAKQLTDLMNSAGGEAKANAVLKPLGGAVKATGLVSKQNTYLPGIGEAPELMKDVFAANSPIDPKQGGKAKAYHSGAWWVVAVTSQSQHADPDKLESQRSKIYSQIRMTKEREMQTAWLSQVTKSASIKKNNAVVKEEAVDEGSGG